MRCVYQKCNVSSNSNSARGLTFHLFPNEPSHFAKWIKAVGRDGWQPVEGSVICSRHFLPGDLFVDLNGLMKLRAGAIPVRYLQNRPCSHRSTPCRVKACRICFTTDHHLYYITLNNNLNVAYETMTGVLVEEEDRLPPYLCTKCSRLLLNSVEFRGRMLDAHRVLQDVIKEEGNLTLDTMLSLKRNHDLVISGLRSRIAQINYFCSESDGPEVNNFTTRRRDRNVRRPPMGPGRVFKTENDDGNENQNAPDSSNDDMNRGHNEHEGGPGGGINEENPNDLSSSTTNGCNEGGHDNKDNDDNMDCESGAGEEAVEGVKAENCDLSATRLVGNSENHDDTQMSTGTISVRNVDNINEENDSLMSAATVIDSNLDNLNQEVSNDEMNGGESLGNSTDSLIVEKHQDVPTTSTADLKHKSETYTPDKIFDSSVLITQDNDSSSPRSENVDVVRNSTVSSMQQSLVPQTEELGVAQNVNIKQLETKIDNITATLKTVLDNQNLLSNNQKNMSLDFAKLSDTIEEILKGFYPHAVMMRDANLNFKPIESVEDLEEFENKLQDSAYEAELVKRFSVICGEQIGYGINAAYRLVDVIFKRDFMKQCSWAGGSRSDDKKICFKTYTRTIEFFFKLVKESDNLYKLVDCESFFKTIMRNSRKRSLFMNVRQSATKRRPKILIRKREVEIDDKYGNTTNVAINDDN